MTARPLIDDWEIPRIATIETLEQRSLVEMSVPGKVGSVYQDLNSVPTRIKIAGSLYGDEANNEFLETIRDKFNGGSPVSFVADILTATEVQYVVIEKLYFQESGVSPDVLYFEMVLAESPPPPPPPDPLGGIDTGLLDDAAGLMDSVTGALDALEALGNIPNFGNPAEPLTGVINDVSSATEGIGDMVSQLTDIFGSPE